MSVFSVFSVFSAISLTLFCSFVKCESTLGPEREGRGEGRGERGEGRGERGERGERGRSFENTIKNCIQTCRRLLFRGDKDLNYCIEGCRIRIYRKIYECVYEQCNEKGNGIPTKFSREQYHQCVYLCKVKPKFKPIQTTATTPTIAPLPGVPTSPAPTTSMATPVPKNHFIPLEYHYFSEKKRKNYKEVKNNGIKV
ncbi:uncharacterized protein LOC128951790 [Oppia nitens]|uniref:uncharacterized protein LOC128951790 n=1 Tax=Oppia nitens TaxID=1686743 RepID=UPI0023D9C071|nr:uncharacterized protein LOC128951790 [Oppia nitens]